MSTQRFYLLVPLLLILSASMAGCGSLSDLSGSEGEILELLLSGGGFNDPSSPNVQYDLGWEKGYDKGWIAGNKRGRNGQKYSNKPPGRKNNAFDQGKADGYYWGYDDGYTVGLQEYRW